MFFAAAALALLLVSGLAGWRSGALKWDGLVVFLAVAVVTIWWSRTDTHSIDTVGPLCVYLGVLFFRRYWLSRPQQARTGSDDVPRE